MIDPQKFTLNVTIDGASPGSVKEIVFREKTKGYAFRLGNIMRAASVEFEEIPSRHIGGGKPGSSIFNITGDIILYQNSMTTARNIVKHLGFLYDIFVLYENGDAVASCLVSGVNTNSLGGAPLKEHVRFPNAQKFRSMFGVTLQVKDSAVAERGLHLILSGTTVDKTEWQVTNDAAFYKVMFPDWDKFPPVGT